MPIFTYMYIEPSSVTPKRTRTLWFPYIVFVPEHLVFSPCNFFVIFSLVRGRSERDPFSVKDRFLSPPAPAHF